MSIPEFFALWPISSPKRSHIRGHEHYRWVKHALDTSNLLTRHLGGKLPNTIVISEWHNFVNRCEQRDNIRLHAQISLANA
jgi:hypothetical protein